jgi:hypothetical protein
VWGRVDEAGPTIRAVDSATTCRSFSPRQLRSPWKARARGAAPLVTSALMPRRLSDPLRPSAGGASPSNHDLWRSMSRSGVGERALCARIRLVRHPACAEQRDEHRSARRSEASRLFKAWRTGRRSADHRDGPASSRSRGAPAAHVQCAASDPAPCHPVRRRPSSSDEQVHRTALPRHAPTPRGDEDCAGKMLLTDGCNRLTCTCT